MSDESGPIYTGGGIPLKGFDGLIQAAAAANTAQQRLAQQALNARQSQQNRIQKLMDDVYQETGADLAPALRPFWQQHVDKVDNQIQAMTLESGEAITSISQGLELLRQSNAFYDELYGYNHFEGKYAADDEIQSIEKIIANPKEREKYMQTVSVDKIYNFEPMYANSELAKMKNYADLGFVGATVEEIQDGSYMAGGYQQYGEIDYSGDTPHLKLNSPNNVADSRTATGMAQPGTYLQGLSIYGANQGQLFNKDRFSDKRSAKKLYNLGQEYLQPLVKADRVGLGWARQPAMNLVDGLIRDTTKTGQEIRYSMLTQERINNPNLLTPEEERAFLYNNPELAFGRDDKTGETVATQPQISALESKFNGIINNSNYRELLIEGSNYDKNVRKDAKAEERDNSLQNTLAGMTTVNPNDLFAIEDIQDMINNDLLFTVPGEADLFNAGFARLLAQQSIFGSQLIPGGTTVDDLLLVKAPSFSMVGTGLEQQAGVTRSFIEQFETSSHFLPQTVGNFNVNMSGSSQFQFSPQTGVEGGIDNIVFTKDASGKLKIGVKLNKSGVTGFGVGRLGVPIEALEGDVSFDIGTPLFRVGTQSDGSNFFEDLRPNTGGITSTDPFAGKSYSTGTPELLFYFDPTNSSDLNRLVTLGSKLDEFYGKKGQQFPNAINSNLGYTLNAMFAKIQQ
mgnify:CR=1 FL=1